MLKLGQSLSICNIREAESFKGPASGCSSKLVPSAACVVQIIASNPFFQVFLIHRRDEILDLEIFHQSNRTAAGATSVIRHHGCIP